MKSSIAITPSLSIGRSISSSNISWAKTATMASSLFRIPGQNLKGTLPVLSWTKSVQLTMLPAGLSTRGPQAVLCSWSSLSSSGKNSTSSGICTPCFLAIASALLGGSYLPLGVGLPLEPRRLPGDHCTLHPPWSGEFAQFTLQNGRREVHAEAAATCRIVQGARVLKGTKEEAASIPQTFTRRAFRRG